MPNVDWSDVIGPVSVKCSTNKELSDIDNALTQTLPYSSRAAAVQRRLIRDDTFSHIESPAAHRLSREASEANVISNNAGAMLGAIDKILEQRRVKRLEEAKKKAGWGWPGAKLPKNPTLARTAAENDQTQDQKPANDPDMVSKAVPSRTQSVRNPLRAAFGEHQPEVMSVHSDPATWARSKHQRVRETGQQSRAGAKMFDLFQSGLPASPVPSSSRKYSRSVDGGMVSVVVSEKVPTTWVWSYGITEAGSARSGTSFEVGQRSSVPSSASFRRRKVIVEDPGVDRSGPTSRAEKGKEPAG